MMDATKRRCLRGLSATLLRRYSMTCGRGGQAAGKGNGTNTCAQRTAPGTSLAGNGTAMGTG